MSTSNSPPSNLRRAIELDTVRDVVLLEWDEHLKAEPVPRHEGAPALRGGLEAKLGAAIASDDAMAERSTSLELAHLHFERGLDLDRAVQLLYRALEIEDDRELRLELARQLAMMGRHVEAGHVLRDGEPRLQHEVVDAWLSSGDAYVRAGDAMEAIATYREVAMLAPDDPRPFIRIAAIAYWDRDAVPVERAADAFIEAGKRFAPGSDGQLLCLARGFEIAPAYARSTEAYTKALHVRGRHREADELWREYGAISGHAFEVAKRSVDWAMTRSDLVAALAAAIDAGIIAEEKTLGLEPLTKLLASDAAIAQLGEHSLDTPAPVALLANAASTEDAATRAMAFEEVARRFRGDVRGLALAFAAEAHARAGDAAKAHTAAELACIVSPTLPRAFAILASTAVQGAGVDSGALEASIGRLPARAWIYQRMATLYQSEGLHSLAAMWTRLVISLRVGDIGPLQLAVDRAVRSREPELIEQAIDLVLQHVFPYRPLASALSRALLALAEVDADSAARTAQRIFAAVGPGAEPLYGTMSRIARETGGADLELALPLRRAVSDEVNDDARSGLYLEAAETCLHRGDVEAAAEHLYCAAAHSAPLERLSALLEALRQPIDDLDNGQRSDALLACAHAAAWTAEQQDATAAIRAWRLLGAIRWDLANDYAGSEEAYFVACAHDREAGPYRYARDLEDRAGAEKAVSMVVERAVAVADEGEELAMCGRLYAAAARIAADSDLYDLAMNAALAAVQTDPSRGDAVAIVEKIAKGEEGLVALDFVYDTLGEAALGRYGFRAAHYRAARQLEVRGAVDRALRHAITAFEAVPSVGAPYRMLLRLAARAGDEGAAVRALAGVAATHPPEEEVQWLLRAADLAKELGGAPELELDLLLRALSVLQRADLVDRIRATADASGATRDEVAHIRLERAVAAALPKLSPANGASTAVALSVLAATTLGDARLAAEALRRAIQLNRYDTSFEPAVPLIGSIASERDVARDLLLAINDSRDASQPLGRGLREITSALHVKLSEAPPPPSSIPPPPSTADMETEDMEARFFDDRTDSPPLPSVISEPPLSAPTVADGRVPDEPELETRQEELELDEAILEEEEALEEEEVREERARRESDVEELLEAADDIEILTDRPRSSDPGSDVEDDDIADRVEDLARERSLTEVEYVESRGQLVPSRPPPARSEPPARSVLAPVDDREPSPSDPGPAGHPHPGLAEADFISPESEQQARERGDHATIARILEQRASGTPRLEERRLIRLRRAAVLEQRLDQLELACAELQTILEEMGEDPTALRYLADLSDRMGRRARAARLWLRASKQATTVEDKLRDVTRCCESLAASGRYDTAMRLLDAAQGLPQSIRMLRLRVGLARRTGNEQALTTTLAELAALDQDGDGVGLLDSVPPAPPIVAPPIVGAPLGSSGAAHRRRQSDRPMSGGTSAPGPSPTSAGGLSSRRVFRVSGSPPSPRELLERCRTAYLDHGVGDEVEAAETVRQLRALGASMDDGERDLLTFLLVEALDTVQGPGSAMHELQRHWESIGGTPLVTSAVADRLARRGELKPALQLYARVLDTNLQGVRSAGQLALEAAELAHQMGDDDAADSYLEHAALHTDARAGAERRYREWFGRPSDWDSTVEHVDAPLPPSSPPEPDLSPVEIRAVEKPTVPPALVDGQEDPIPPVALEPQSSALLDGSGPEGPALLDGSGREGPALLDGSRPEGPALFASSEPNEAPSFAASVEPTPSSIPSSQPRSAPQLRRPATFPELLAPREEELYGELIQGSYDAGDSLVAIFDRDATSRTHDVLAVRRYQATLRHGDRRALARLRDAAVADHANAFARALEHVLAAFDPAAEAVEPPELEQLAAQPEATARLLFGSLAGTINEGLALVCESGMFRRELASYELTGTDRVVASASTALGRTYGALSRLLDLGGVRLYHRERRTGSLQSSVALATPLAAILKGAADREGPSLRYVLGSALAAATPALALVEALEESQARTLVGALLAGFGPIDDGSMTESSATQMRMAEDLWHMLPSAADQRLRELCRNRHEMTYEAAVANANATKRRAGLFACGDLVTATVQIINDLELQVPRPIRGEGALRELCQEPAIADLVDLATLPEYAEARWSG